MTNIGSTYIVDNLGLCKVTDITDDRVYFDILGSKRRKGWYARFYWDERMRFGLVERVRES
jgi:hypothetical protein